MFLSFISLIDTDGELDSLSQVFSPSDNKSGTTSFTSTTVSCIDTRFRPRVLQGTTLRSLDHTSFVDDPTTPDLSTIRLLTGDPTVLNLDHMSWDRLPYVTQSRPRVFRGTTSFDLFECPPTSNNPESVSRSGILVFLLVGGLTFNSGSETKRHVVSWSTVFRYR